MPGYLVKQFKQELQVATDVLQINTYRNKNSN
jgi:hypothetical protein